MVGTLAPPATAQSVESRPLVTDRPTFTASTSVVAPGAVVLESGYTLSRANGVSTHALGEALFRIGLSTKAEIRVGLNSFAWAGAGGPDGLEDASLGFKVELASGSDSRRFDPLRPAVALLIGTTIPTGSTEFGESEMQPGAVLALSWHVSDRVGMSVNTNVAAASESGERYGQFSGAGSMGISVSERVGVFGEYFIFAPPGLDQETTGLLHGGITILISPDFQVDGRAGRSLHGVDTDVFVGVGFATRF